MKKKTICALLAAASTVSVGAQTLLNGNQLLTDMKSDRPVAQAFSAGYVVAIADVSLGVEFCPPGQATVRQLSDVVKKFMEENPVIRSEPGYFIVLRALRESWPCPTSK